ncbi:hypothetical protein A2192_01315 [Candidatus Nomurabacteria bacterium RIFOXYA1_FULL_35_17]|uniref:HEPN AbiU2-like domain-containing protein n=1 Tax=Candidatus Nomurabacteria bacterium RIFOXYA1_FULL_35_17 TaxID=1801798 RepID=A0A1F6YHK2_9BACT|nr:MAG: hypothetical protein A2192_01315 [Candidatus Nomurabacteria bacterium RIFOXYA1_FULL_35_17]
MDSNKSKEFGILIQDLADVYMAFCLNRIMHQEVKDRIYGDHAFIWNPILRSLEKGYLLGLARIFDKQFDRPDEPKNVISIYYFLDYKFTKHEETISKIKKVRNKFLAHSDKETLKDLEKFIKDLKFESDRSDIESLFNAIIEVLDEIKINFGFNKNIKNYFEQLKEDIIIKFDKFLGGFKNN